MSVRTNPMKAVPSLLRRLNEVRSKTQSTKIDKDDELIVKELDKLNSQLNNKKDLFSTVKQNEEELLDILTNFDGILRKFDPNKFKSNDDIVKRILDPYASQSKTKDSETSRQISQDVEDNEKGPQKEENKGTEKDQKDKNDLYQALKKISKSINRSTQKLQLDGASESGQPSQNAEQDKVKEEHRQLSLRQQKNDLVDQVVDQVLKSIWVSYDNLNLQSRLCLLSLSIFPEKAVIKKRHSIYWWIGEGFVKKAGEQTAEEVGEDVFHELLNCDLIVPHGNGKCPVVNKFQINPWIRHMLLSSLSTKKDHLFGFYSQIITSSDHNSSSSTHACLVLDQEKVNMSDKDRFKFNNARTVFNVGARYLSFGSQWLAGMKKLVVLQLGRWQDSASHHIEVDNEEFLKDLMVQKHLKYLSLCGISRISKLPSIVQLVSLEILDLKACHNLETLPNDIASLTRLTHLDVSQCYLLESMPKGIEKLTELQVLKGFVIGSSSKTPCRIRDLARLKNLKRLSIHIGSEAVIQDREFESLEKLSKVKRLKISWGVPSTRYEAIFQQHSFSFPQSLEKLDLEGFPGEEIPEWLKPSKLPKGLKKLYIKGGKLKTLDHGEEGQKWQVEIVRVKYLNDRMEIGKQKLKEIEKQKLKELFLQKLRELFPSLKYGYVQKLKEPEPFEIEWSIEG